MIKRIIKTLKEWRDDPPDIIRTWYRFRDSVSLNCVLIFKCLPKALWLGRYSFSKGRCDPSFHPFGSFLGIKFRKKNRDKFIVIGIEIDSTYYLPETSFAIIIFNHWFGLFIYHEKYEEYAALYYEKRSEAEL